MIRLGVIGTGRIAARFMQDIALVPQIQATGIYNPHISSANTFAQKYEVAQATDDWEQFLSEVDAVYIASPHQTHVAYARKALQKKKHVLCEKPMAFLSAEVEELFALAKKNEVVLMEAIKTAYCPGFLGLLKTVESGVIGTVRDVEACFTRLTDPAGRERTDPVYGGSVTEYGTYVLLPVVKILGGHPADVQFHSIRDENGVDLFTKINLAYEQGFGLGKVGVGVKSEGDLIISGTKGYIYVKAPWWMTREFQVRFEDPDKKEVHIYEYERSGLQYELQAFVKDIQAKQKEYETKKSMSMAIAGIMERFFESGTGWDTSVLTRSQFD